MTADARRLLTKREMADLRDNPEHPILKQLQATLERNPGLARSHVVNNWGVGRKTLEIWEGKGWVKFRLQPRISNTMAWIPRKTRR